MLKFKLRDWTICIQKNFIQAGYSSLSQLEGFKSAKHMNPRGYEMEFWIEFETPQQETLFILRFA